MALDTRWKNPQGSDPRSLWRWAQDIITELRKGDYLSTVGAQEPTLIASGSLSGSSVVLATSIEQTFPKLILSVTGMSFDTASRHALLQVSSDNGSNYDTTDANYDAYTLTGAVAGATLATAVTHSNVGDTADLIAAIEGYQAGMYPKSDGHYRIVVAGIPAATPIWAAYNAATDAIDALRLIVGGGAGNFDAGAWALYGIR